MNRDELHAALGGDRLATHTVTALTAELGSQEITIDLLRDSRKWLPGIRHLGDGGLKRIDLLISGPYASARASTRRLHDSLGGDGVALQAANSLLREYPNLRENTSIEQDVDYLSGLRRCDLLDIRNVGPRSVDRVVSFLKEHGKSLAECQSVCCLRWTPRPQERAS